MNSGETDATIRGFSITNGFEHANYGFDGGGLKISYCSNISVINCKFYDNYGNSGGGGLFVRHSSVSLSGVDIFNNYSCYGGGIYVRDDSEIIFDEMNLCNIYNNYAGKGSDIFAIDAVADIDVIVDTFTVLDPSTYFAGYFHNLNNEGEMTFDIQNYWLETVNHNLYVTTDGDDSNSGLTPDEPLRTIAWALHKIESDSINPKTVYVASGTYSQSLNNQIFPLGCKRYVSIIGEDRETTILNNEYCYRMFIAYFDESNFSIENFILHNTYLETNGFINIQYCDNIVFRNIVVEDCISIDSWLTMFYRADNLLFENVIFRNNTAEYCAGIWFDGGNAKFKYCILDNNHSTGNQGSWANYSNFYFVAAEYLEIENGIFSNSSTVNPDWDVYTTFAIGKQQFCEPIVNIKNSLFYNNSSVSKAAISISSNYNPMPNNIINCTFADNSSQSSTLVLSGVNSVYNTVMHDSTDYEIELPDYSAQGYISTLNVSHCNIKNGEAGIYNENGVNIVNWLEGNINQDPLFIGTGDYPFALSALSPCIDAGTPDTTGLNLPEFDLAGNPRIYNDIIDMGAYEYQDTIGVDEPDYPLFIFDLFQNNPNPFSSKTTISFILASYEHLNEYILSIYNIRGQLIKTFCGRGNNFWVKTDIVWDGTDEDGKRVSPGVYFYKLEYGQNALTKKMTLVR